MNDMEILRRAYEREPWELAWSAAFLEGEGTLTINVSPPSEKCRSHSPRYTLWVKADNTEPEPIYRLQAFFGGAVRRYKSKRGFKPAYRWLVTSRGAAACLQLIKQYFASKRKQTLANYLLELNKRLRGTPMGGVRLTETEIAARESIVAEVRKLNMRHGRQNNWRKARAHRCHPEAPRLTGI